MRELTENEPDLRYEKCVNEIEELRDAEGGVPYRRTSSANVFCIRYNRPDNMKHYTGSGGLTPPLRPKIRFCLLIIHAIFIHAFVNLPHPSPHDKRMNIQIAQRM